MLTWALVLPALSAPALGQTYPIATPVTRSNDPAVLRRTVSAREIHERFTRGLADENRESWNEATAEFERIVALAPPEPANSTARYDAAIAYAHMARYDRAIVLLRDALTRDPGFAAAAANLVSVALLAGDIPTARAAADRFIAIAPQAARAHYQRGLIALESGDLETARDDFRSLIGTDPTYAVAHYDLALVEVKAGELGAAEAELDRALALSPGYARARFALGSVLVREGRRSEARAAFDRAARDASDSSLHDLAISVRDQL